MTPKLKSQLKSAREALAAALAASHAGEQQLAKAEQDRTGVATEIEQLEVATEANPDDEGGIARLAILRERLRLLDKKFARLQTEQLRDESPRIALAEALSDAVRLLIEAGKPTLDRLTEQATGALAPYYQPGARLELAAQRCDAVLSLRAFLVNAGRGPDDKKPERALSLLDALIAGEPLPWAWPASVPAPDELKHAAA
jgi:hypothetical protein